MRALGWAAVITCAASAQEPRFEVVSIRAVPPDAPSVLREFGWSPVLPGGQYINSRAGLQQLILFAYNVPDYWRLSGLPKWAESQSYSISAKPAEGFPALPPAENRERVRAMVRAMLTDRFQLQVRTTSREEAVFHLDVAKGGLKIKETEAPVSTPKEPPLQLVLSNRDGRMLSQRGTVAGIARAVAVWVQRPVIDRTGLTGYYDFDIRWNNPDGPASQELGADGIALLLSAMQDQLGLRLTKATGSVDYWIVDRVERPSEN